jgi:hypothetical protein
MTYSGSESSLSNAANESIRSISKRERGVVIAGSVLGGAYIGMAASLLVLEHLPVDVSPKDVAYAIGASAFAGAAIFGEEAFRATRRGFNIPMGKNIEGH